MFAERLGQNPLAVPAGRVTVQPRGSVGLLADLDPWLDRLRRETSPAAVRLRLRQVEAAMFTVARGGEAASLRQLLVAVGRLHEAVAQSGSSREAVKAPLVIGDVEGWWAALEPDSAKLRLAGAFASARDRPADAGLAPPPTLRLLLTP